MSQCRTHIFFLLICGRSARFIRWDPSGFIVSSAFDYHRAPRLLAVFLWRFDNLPPEGRGYDITVSEPTDEEASLARSALKDHLNKSAISFIKLTVSNEGDDTVSEYIAPRPKYVLHSPIGRSTRGFTAYNVDDDRVVYVKDQWRVDEPGTEKEQEIYTELYKHGVRHIPRLERGSDVLDHATITKKFLDKPWANLVGVIQDKLIGYKHHRLVFRDVGRDLRTFTSTRELVSAIADAMEEGHWDAFKKAGLLHRDISVGNILISERGEGLLIDWELCARVDKEGPRLFERTGTWQFISAAILLENNKLHELQDDLESFLWTSIKFTDYNLNPTKLRRVLSLFDEAELNPGDGTTSKRDALRSNSFKTDVEFHSGPLNALLRSLCPVFASRYIEEIPPENDLEAAKALYYELGGDEGASVDGRFRYDPCKYILNSKRLEDSTWIIKTMKTLLDSGDWPTNDRAKRQEVLAPVGRHAKRTSQQADLVSFHSTIAKRLRLDEAGTARIIERGPFGGHDYGEGPFDSDTD